MWLTSQDEEFRAKRDEVLHVYYDTPQNEHIICLDEMTGMQILERLCLDIPMAPGMPVRREYEYKRHGSLTLMGALDVRRGKVVVWHNQSSKPFRWSYRPKSWSQDRGLLS
jgi:hypothetical protein